jgi:hypothetical protein
LLRADSQDGYCGEATMGVMEPDGTFSFPEAPPGCR